ncbi:MAG: ABC transporter permease [Candidatus Nanohaloarchaea archaeon]|nr:ABC transporter permease [Candidatus Nanohaloarchaea archaeon]
MKLYRIYGIMLKNLYYTRRNLDRIFDVFYWPVVGLFTWGFTTLYLRNVTQSSKFISFFLGALILWMFVQRWQQDISTFMLTDFWSQNIYNMFSSPITNFELFLGTALFSGVRALISLGLLLVLAALFYAFNLLSIGVFGLAMLAASLAIFGSGLGLFVAGLIYRFGQRIQVFAWSTIVLLQPFSAVFYPRDVLPGVFHDVSLALPTSYVFEGMRASLQTGVIPWSDIGISFALSFLYFGLGYLAFHVLLERSRRGGYLAQNN